MKILSITLKNLNSLRGTWHIDLTGKEYESEGIFAVTGPTGAGKTTIFDAVCLALYSQTSRLGRIGGQSNEIMTRRTNECAAKVTFEAKGTKYTCEWEQVRTKGRLQTAKHTIAYTETGEIIGDKKKSTAGIVAEITGMDFSRFRQSMLLEQGRFDRFLSADKNSRAAILELITGTEIYSKISSSVFDRTKEERLKKDDIQREINEETLRLGGMTEENIQSEINRTEEEISQSESRHKSLREILSWLDDMDNLRVSVEGVKKEIESQVKLSESFAEERGILEAAERALSLDGEYSTLCAKRDDRSKVNNEMLKLSARISSNEAECSRISSGLPALSEELSRLKGDIPGTPAAVLAGIEAAVRNYDAQDKSVAEAEKALSEAKNELEKAQRNSERAISEGKSARARMNEANEKYRRILDQLNSMRARTTSAVLDQERENLKDGVPCPLCGSLTHPSAVHKDSGGENPDELFRETDRLDAELKRAESAVKSAEKYFNDVAVENWNKASGIFSAAEQKHKQCSENLLAMREKRNEYHIAVSDSIRPLRISGVSNTPEILRIAREWAVKAEALEKRIQDSQQELSRIQAVIMSDRESLDAKSSELHALSEELGRLESSFREKLRDKNFPDEESFVHSRRKPDDIEDMRNRKTDIDTRMNTLQGLLSSKQKELDAKKAMNLTDKPRGEIESQYRQEDSRLKQLHQNKGSLTQNLITAQTLTAKIAGLKSEYSRQCEICGNWEELCALIGSSKGDKYSVFAQKVTLGLVVNNANDYLKSMNGRYTLILTPESNNLELSVKDSEQAGEIRPTSNLSGGERFIISLALALGLSQISGSKAQVDSLFIDEGFGSLDEEALNAALEALGEIHRKGRMIGIISHVSGISERIRAKINVIRKSEGTSIIEGPGCFRIESKI